MSLKNIGSLGIKSFLTFQQSKLRFQNFFLSTSELQVSGLEYWVMLMLNRV